MSNKTLNKTMEIPEFLKSTGRELPRATISKRAKELGVQKSDYERYLAALGYLKPENDNMNGITYRLTKKGALHCHTVQGFFRKKVLWDFETFSQVVILHEKGL